MEGYKTTLGELMRGATFEIPPYQRDFDWIQENVEDLINDLKYSSEKDLPLFLGNFTFKLDRPSSKERWEVVDGQQRMTTIVIFGVALRQILMQRARDEEDNDIMSRVIPPLIDCLMYEADVGGRILGPKFLAAQSIRNMLESICLDPNFDGTNFPRSSEPQGWDLRKIKKYLKFFTVELKDMQTIEIKKMFFTLSKCELLVTLVFSNEEAFNLFEVLNARGKQLEIGDLLKNHIFSKHTDEGHYDELINCWNGMLANLSDKSKSTDLVLMLRHYYFTKDGHITKNQLYRELKRLIEDRGMLIDSFVVEVLSYSEWHKEVADGNKDAFKNLIFDEYLCGKWPRSNYENHADRLYFSFAALKLFNFKPVFPLLYSYFNKIKKLIQEDKIVKSRNDKLFGKMEKFLRRLENYHFINYKVCSQKVAFIEKLFAEYAKSVNNTTSQDELDQHVEALFKKLKADLKPKDEFELSFRQIKYEQKTETKRFLRYIFERFNISRTLRATNTDSSIFDYDVKTGVPSIEHWAPENPEEGDPYMEIWASLEKEAIHNIGNLLVLLTTTNSMVGNRSPINKSVYIKQLLEEQKITNYGFFNEFLENYEPVFEKWGKENIEERATHLAREAYSTVWKFE